MVLSQHPWSILVPSLENNTDVQIQRLRESEKNTDTAWAGSPEVGEECEARLTSDSHASTAGVSRLGVLCHRDMRVSKGQLRPKA